MEKARRQCVGVEGGGWGVVPSFSLAGVAFQMGAQQAL